MVFRSGAGPSPLPFKELTAESLASQLLEAFKPEMLERAKELGDRIKEENGCAVGAASFHQQMNVEGMRCMMAPSRVAVWQVNTKTDHIRLSAFAATVLTNKGIIDVNHLKLYRSSEYLVEEFFMASNLSGANPVLGTIGSVTSQLINWPINGPPTFSFFCSLTTIYNLYDLVFIESCFN